VIARSASDEATEAEAPRPGTGAARPLLSQLSRPLAVASANSVARSLYRPIRRAGAGAISLSAGFAEPLMAALPLASALPGGGSAADGGAPMPPSVVHVLLAMRVEDGAGGWRRGSTTGAGCSGRAVGWPLPPTPAPSLPLVRAPSANVGGDEGPGAVLLTLLLGAPGTPLAETARQLLAFSSAGNRCAWVCIHAAYRVSVGVLRAYLWPVARRGFDLRYLSRMYQLPYCLSACLPIDRLVCAGSWAHVRADGARGYDDEAAIAPVRAAIRAALPPGPRVGAAGDRRRVLVELEGDDVA
jgi:hypothetical protein